MRCTAILFNLDVSPSKSNPGRNNHFLTFVDKDTGESFRTYIDEKIAAKYQKMKEVEMELAISVGEYNGRPQLNTRIISITDKPASSVQFPKTGTNG